MRMSDFERREKTRGLVSRWLADHQSRVDYAVGVEWCLWALPLATDGTKRAVKDVTILLTRLGMRNLNDTVDEVMSDVGVDAERWYVFALVADAFDRAWGEHMAKAVVESAGVVTLGGFGTGRGGGKDEGC